jgi:AcrR family transcriptional regulator
MVTPNPDSRGPTAARRLDLRVVSALFAERQLDNVTMAEVAARAGVAKPTLYRLAGSKQQLVDTCIDAEAERLIGHLHEQFALAADDETAIAVVLAAVAAFAQDSAGGFALLFEQRLHGSLPRIRRAESSLAALLRSADNPETTAAAILGMAAAAVSRTLADRRESGSKAEIDAEQLLAAIRM